MTTTDFTPQHRTWSLELPFNAPLNLNARQHWAVRAKAAAEWKDAAIVLARAAHIPHLQRFTVVLHYAPRDRRRRDVDNLVVALKPLVDGLVQAGVCEDDDHTRYVLSSPQICEPTGLRGRLWIDVIDLGEGQ